MSSINTLSGLIHTIPVELQVFAEEEAAKKATPGSWSKKEILGHLCDSATNNHMRFVKIVLSPDPIRIEKYQQNQWVSLHDYQANYSYTDLVMLWIFLNKQILYVLKKGIEEQFNKPVVLDDHTTVTLGWLLEDYVNHMLHHVNQILERTV